MYFELSPKRNKDFPNSYNIKNLTLSTDMGWNEILGNYGKIIYKGYAYEDLENLLKLFEPSTSNIPRGSFTAFIEKDNQIHLVTDDTREFPIFFDEEKKIVTNLTQQKKIIYPDNFLTVNCASNAISHRYNGPIFKKKTDKDLNYVTEQIFQMLNNDIKNFTSLYKHPIKIIPTGGIDSTLMIALLKYNNIDFEVIDYEYKKWSYFHFKNKDKINVDIGNQEYTSIGHTWGIEPVTMATGFRGDQFFFREYLPIAILSKIEGINLNNEFKKYGQSYSYNHMMKQSVAHREELERLCRNVQDRETAYKQVFAVVQSTFHNWSIENTCYWSVFKNINIVKEILQMSFTNLITNCMEATVQKKILTMIDPNLLDVIINKKDFSNHNFDFDKDRYDKLIKTLTNY